MPKFLQNEIAAYAGEKTGFSNVEFRKNSFENSPGARQGTLVEIIPVHIKNPPVIQFMAFIDTLGDSFTNQYHEEQPFGRTDPYYIWKSSKRSIRLSLSLPSSSKSRALENINNLGWLMSSLYPSYKDTDSATSISASPLFRIRYSNLVASRSQDGQGLLCVIKSANVNHMKDQGFIFVKPRGMGSSSPNVDGQVIQAAGFQDSFPEGDVIQVPRLMKLDLTFDVVHDHMLGWDHSTGEWRAGSTGAKYPYGFGLQREVAPIPGAIIEEAVPGSPDARNAEALDEQIGSMGT